MSRTDERQDFGLTRSNVGVLRLGEGSPLQSRIGGRKYAIATLEQRIEETDNCAHQERRCKYGEHAKNKRAVHTWVIEAELLQARHQIVW